MDNKLIHIEESQGILIIQLNRPEKHNALTQEMYKQLNEAITKLNTDQNLRVGFLCGTGGQFTAGNDLQDFLNARSPEDLKHVAEFLFQLGKIQKPLIAAIEGCAVGIGTTLLPYCDLVYASEDAYFQTPFVDLGLCPEAGSSILFPRLMGYHRAAELLFLGEKISAEKAETYGLITSVIKQEKVYDYAMSQAIKLTNKSPDALLAAKTLLRFEENTSLEGVVERENAVLFQLLGSPHTMKIIQALKQKIGTKV